MWAMNPRSVNSTELIGAKGRPGGRVEGEKNSDLIAAEISG